MDGASGMKGGKMEAIKESTGMEIKRLDSASFAKYERDILSLDRNVLDKEEGKGFTEREDDVKNLSEKYLKTGKELLVAIEDEHVVAYIAVDIDSDHERATIEQFRVRSDIDGASFAEEFLMGAKSQLLHEGVLRCTLMLEGRLRKSVKTFEENSWFTNFFDVLEKSEQEENEEPHVAEAA